MKKIIKSVSIFLLVILALPGDALCEKKHIIDDTAYNPYYDLLSQSGTSMPTKEKEPLVPETMAGRKAIGYGGNPGLYGGLSIKYWFRDNIAGNLNVKLLYEKKDNIEYNVNIRPKILINFLKSNILLVNLFAGVDFLLSSNVEHTSKSEYHFLYGFAGISPELFITNNFSIETSFGVYIEFWGEETDAGGNKFRTHAMGTFGETISLTSINFHIYF